LGAIQAARKTRTIKRACLEEWSKRPIQNWLALAVLSNIG
jgi:hypothetical protein